MNQIRFAKIACMVTLFSFLNVFAQAQTFTTITNLPKKLDHITQLIEGEDGNLIGTNSGAGPYGVGAILRITLTGQGTLLYRFCRQTNCPDGEAPEGVYQAVGGKFYGLADEGGASGNGALFQLSSAGKETVLYSFCSQVNCTDGSNPTSAPVPSLKAGLLGSTSAGGANNEGTLFEVSPTGKLATLYSFCAQTNCTDGAVPVSSPIQTADGAIYGTTNNGGTYAEGNIYTLTPQGHLLSLYSFSLLVPGFVAVPTLIQGADGNFYGVTHYGGSATNFGSAFQITPQGQFTNLYTFCPKSDCSHGAAPVTLVQGSDGNLYGVTSGGGTFNNGGTIFQLTPRGVLTTLYTFCKGSTCIDGEQPQSLVQDTNGTFYGTTSGGGTLSGGTVFSLSVGLAPFVQTNPGFGKAGAEVGILGNNLTGTTSVTFNGTAAEFSVMSDTYIKATVPGGATTGKIAVTTPAGTLTSNFPFQVLP